jgi:hypothetical protein
VQDFFETGDRLRDAINELDPEDYNKMLAEIGMDSATARKLRLIAKNDVLRSHENALPRDYNSIYLLSQIPEERLEPLIEEGVVHQNLKRRETKNLKNAHGGDHARPTPRGARPVQQIVASDIEDEDEFHAEGGEDAAADETEGETDPDAEQIAQYADDVPEALRETLDGNRYEIEQVLLHGDQMTRAMLASGLRDHIAAVARLADELDPQGAATGVSDQTIAAEPEATPPPMFGDDLTIPGLQRSNPNAADEPDTPRREQARRGRGKR